MSDQRLGLGGLERGRFNHDQAAVLDLGRERMTTRQRANFLGQSKRMRARPRAERTAAATELRHPVRSVTCTAGALLLVHLLAGAPDIGAALRLVRAGLTL